jgi:hypothetical protein
MRVVRKSKFKIFLVQERACQGKKLKKFTPTGNFFILCRESQRGREVRLLDAGERPIRTPPHKIVGSEFLFLGIVFLEFSIHSGRSILQFVS